MCHPSQAGCSGGTHSTSKSQFSSCPNTSQRPLPSQILWPDAFTHPTHDIWASPDPMIPPPPNQSVVLNWHPHQVPALPQACCCLHFHSLPDESQGLCFSSFFHHLIFSTLPTHLHHPGMFTKYGCPSAYQTEAKQSLSLADLPPTPLASSPLVGLTWR